MSRLHISNEGEKKCKGGGNMKPAQIREEKAEGSNNTHSRAKKERTSVDNDKTLMLVAGKFDHQEKS